MRLLRLALLILILSTVLAGCAAQPDRLWIQSPDWSRAQLIGSTRVGDPVPIAVADNGMVCIFLIQALDNQTSPRVVAFDKNGTIEWDILFDEWKLKLPAQPQILWDGDKLLLFWINDYQLYGASLNPQGEWLEEPQILSANHPVDAIDAAINSSGLLGLWFSSPPDQPGLFAVTDPFVDPQITLIDSRGTKPDLIYDEAGSLHALWARYTTERGTNDFVYGVYPSGHLINGNVKVLVSPVVYGTAILEGPHLGIDATNAYVFWSVTFLSGPEAGTVRAQYVYVPRGEHTPVSTPRILTVPWSHDLEYEQVLDTSISSGRRVVLEPGFNGGGSYLIQINPNQQNQGELVLSFQARLGYLMRKVQSQVAVAYLEAGNPSAYQQISFTQSQSSSPNVISDNQGYLHLTWLEKGAVPGWAIYYTSTAPGLVDGFGGLSIDDTARVSIEALFGLAIGGLLIPIAIAWVLPSTIIFLLGMRISDWINIRRGFGGLAAFGLAITALWVAKLGILPGISSYVPFSAWIPFLPRSLDLPLRIGIPLLIMSSGLLGAWLFSRSSEDKSTLQFFFAYAIIDGLLTMSIYGVLIIASF